MANLEGLPTDIFLAILSYLSFSDIQSLKKTCKSFNEFTKLRSLWHLLINQVQEQNIPIPRHPETSLDSLTAEELERLFFKTIGLQRNWRSTQPVVRNELVLEYSAPDTQVGVISLQFVPGKSRYLVSVIYTNLPDQRRLFTIQCWDVAAQPQAKCVATRTVQQNARLVIDSGPSPSIRLAIQPQDCIEFLTVDTSSSTPVLGFTTEQRIPHRSDNLLHIHGKRVLSTDGFNRLFFWLAEDPKARTELQTVTGQTGPILEVVYLEGVLLVFRRDRIELFSTPTLPIPHGTRTAPSIASHTWQWRLDSVSVAVCPRTSTGPRGNYPPVNVLLRFGSMLPWPVNMLHFYCLSPNPSFDHTRPAELGNVPYEIPPTLRRTIGSPVNLFSSYHMAVGPRGTALWIDSHTEDGQNERGQRLAGSIVAHNPPRAPSSPEGASESSPDSDSVETTLASSIFRYNDIDDWIRVAVDEEEGRVAIGRKDGSIVLLDYA